MNYIRKDMENTQLLNELGLEKITGRELINPDLIKSYENSLNIEFDMIGRNLLKAAFVFKSAYVLGAIVVKKAISYFREDELWLKD